MSESYEKMSVIELRKIAKEQGVKLGAGINKQGIIEKLMENSGKADAAPAAEPVQLSMQAPEGLSRPIRSAAIITDDEAEEDEPVLTPNPGVRAARPAPASPAQSGSTLGSISSKAPAFTLEGSQAWHNPRAYQGQSNYQHTSGASWSRPAQPAEPRGYSRAPITARPDARTQPARPTPPPVTYNRFGPDQGRQETETRPTEYRQPAYGQQPAAPDYGPPRMDYAPARENALAGPGGAYPHSAGASYRKDPAPLTNQGISEILAAGECGDGEGVLEMHPDGYGFLRAENYQPGKKDVYISNAQVRRFSLRTGDYIVGKTRPQREADRYSAMLYITEINGASPEEDGNRLHFEELTPVYPQKRVNLSGKRENDPMLRVMDLMAPVGFGQRLLIRALPGADYPALLRKMSAAIGKHHLKTHMMMLLVGERPEEVTEIKENFKGEVVYSTFDEMPDVQIKSVELALERAMRLAEQKKDVVVFLDNVTRLARACSAMAQVNVRALPCGLTVGALSRVKKAFGAARSLKEGGSLTLVAVAQDKPDDAASAVILDELGDVANAVWTLDGQQKADGLLPLISGVTLHAQDMFTEPEQEAAAKLRAAAQNDFVKASAILQKTESNEEFLEKADQVLNGEA